MTGTGPRSNTHKASPKHHPPQSSPQSRKLTIRRLVREDGHDERRTLNDNIIYSRNNKRQSSCIRSIGIVLRAAMSGSPDDMPMAYRIDRLGRIFIQPDKLLQQETTSRIVVVPTSIVWERMCQG
jgi:hypothetical protein